MIRGVVQQLRAVLEVHDVDMQRALDEHTHGNVLRLVDVPLIDSLENVRPGVRSRLFN